TSTPIRAEPNIRQTSNVRVFQAGDNIRQYLAKLALNVSHRRIASQNAALPGFAVVRRQISNGLLQRIKLVNKGLHTLGNGSSILLNLNSGFTRFGEIKGQPINHVLDGIGGTGNLNAINLHN